MAQVFWAHGLTTNSIQFYLNAAGLLRADVHKADDNWTYDSSGYLLSDGVFAHVVLVFNGTDNSLKYYVDADLKKTTNVGQSLYSHVGGVGHYDFSSFVTGVIDEVRIYNRALSVAEIQENFQKSPYFSSKLLAKVPKGTTQVMVTVSWQGIGGIDVTIQSPSNTFTESNVTDIYQKNVYSTADGTSGMLNIKRLSVSVSALSSNENWHIILTFDNVEDYRTTVEVQK